MIFTENGLHALLVKGETVCRAQVHGQGITGVSTVQAGVFQERDNLVCIILVLQSRLPDYGIQLIPAKRHKPSEVVLRILVGHLGALQQDHLPDLLVQAHAAQHRVDLLLHPGGWTFIGACRTRSRSGKLFQRSAANRLIMIAEVFPSVIWCQRLVWQRKCLVLFVVHQTEKYV